MEMKKANKTKEKIKNKKVIVIFGDSLLFPRDKSVLFCPTDSILKEKDTYSYLISTLSKKEGIKTIIMRKRGRTVTDAYKNLKNEVILHKPKIVILSI